LGAIAGCTQPISISTLRAWVRGGLRRGRWHLVLQHRRQQRAYGLPGLHRRPEHGRGHALLQRPAQGTLASRARHLLVDDAPADLDQVAVLHAGRAGGLAVATGQAAVEVELRGARGRVALEHLLDEVNAATRPVELVAEQLIGRAGGGAEAAVHALAQDGFSLLSVCGVTKFSGEFGLHVG